MSNFTEGFFKFTKEAGLDNNQTRLIYRSACEILKPVSKKAAFKDLEGVKNFLKSYKKRKKDYEEAHKYDFCAGDKHRQEVLRKAIEKKKLNA